MVKWWSWQEGGRRSPTALAVGIIVSETNTEDNKMKRKRYADSVFATDKPGREPTNGDVNDDGDGSLVAMDGLSADCGLLSARGSLLLVAGRARSGGAANSSKKAPKPNPPTANGTMIQYRSSSVVETISGA